MGFWLKRGLLVLFVLLLAAAGVGMLAARKSLPAGGSGALVVRVEKDVAIQRDQYGIPHISANSMEDLFFAQGFTQAQDRLWQMDLSRRAVAGRLSEIFGEEYVEADHFLRSLLMRHSAEQAVELLAPRAREFLDSYVSGVNAYIAGQGRWLPPEFLLLGYQPEEWTVADTLSIGKYMAWDLPGNMQTELFLSAAVEALPRELALELFPRYPEDGPAILSERVDEYLLLGEAMSGKGALALLETSTLLSSGVSGQELGSNNWVVGGDMTASGKPLLANDMHLGMGIPSIWYQTRLEIPGELALSGVIFPGVPGIIVGTNGHVAWGVTNVGPDVQDLYLERENPDNPYLFEFNGHWEEAVVLEELIFVKGWEEPVRKEIRITRNGPVISDAMDDLQDPVSLRWTAHDHTTEIEAVLAFMEARNWGDFKKALDLFHVPAQNFVFADVEGNIAYRANGRIPIRDRGDGLLPAPGWDPRYQWKGFIPFDALPSLFNPASGFIYTANHKVAPHDYPHFLSFQWAPPYRALSIRENLTGKDGLTVADMQDLQMNVDNLQAQKLLPVFLEALEEGPWNEIEKESLEILTSWGENPRDAANEPGASLYHALYVKALEKTFKEEMGEELFERFQGGHVVNTFDGMLMGGSLWFEQASGGLDGIIKGAFSAAVNQLSEDLGGEPATWTWGRLHQIHLKHPMGQIPVLGILLNDGPYPMQGSHLTVAAASYSIKEPFMVRSSAPWRYIADLSDLGENSWENLAGGASGHPLSRHYKDQTSLWLEGDYSPVALGMISAGEVAGQRKKKEFTRETVMIPELLYRKYAALFPPEAAGIPGEKFELACTVPADLYSVQPRHSAYYRLRGTP